MQKTNTDSHTFKCINTHYHQLIAMNNTQSMLVKDTHSVGKLIRIEYHTEKAIYLRNPTHNTTNGGGNGSQQRNLLEMNNAERRNAFFIRNKYKRVREETIFRIHVY